MRRSAFIAQFVLMSIATLALPLGGAEPTLYDRPAAPSMLAFREWLAALESKDSSTAGLYPYFKADVPDSLAPEEFLSPLTTAKCVLFWLQESDLPRAMRPARGLLSWQRVIERTANPRVAGALPAEIVMEGETWVAGRLFYSSDNLVILEALLAMYDVTGAREFYLGAEKVTSSSADWHFAPTMRALQNLVREGKDVSTIHVTGNTVIDAMFRILRAPKLAPLDVPVLTEKEILVTLHRRESFGDRVQRICLELKRIVETHSDVSIVLPVHWNPNVRGPIKDILGDVPRVQLIPPLPYHQFLQLLRRCHIVITDSGGIQEEAPSLGKPVVVLREVTERSEAVDAGVAVLVGTDPTRIGAAVDRLLTDPAAYRRMARQVSPFGDGKASERIVSILLRDEDCHESVPRSGAAELPVRVMEPMEV